MAEEALEYSNTAGDVETGARLVEELMLPAYGLGRGDDASAVVLLAGAGNQQSAPENSPLWEEARACAA